MLQASTISRSTEGATTQQLKELRARADELKLRASDLEVRKGQLGQQRAALGGDVSPAAVEKQFADVQHELSSTYIQLESTNQEIRDVEAARDMSHVGITVQPPMPSEPLFGREQLEMTGVGLFMLLLPFVLAYTRRIWRRSGIVPSVIGDDRERLQRMEQAIESIALEVERIGEAQRFTTKLLVERQPDAMARIPRREPGTITPH
jgi:hypothetical protein